MPLGLKIILATAGVLVLLGGGAIGALFYLEAEFNAATESPRRTTSAGPRPTASRTTQPRPTAATSTRPPPTRRPPVTRPPTSRPPTSAPPPRPAHLEPQQGYAPVPLPEFPRSEAEAVRAAKNSTIYREKVSKSTCSKLPDLTAHPYGNVSVKKMRSRLQIMADCAAAMWRKPLREAGFQATKVSILVYSGHGKSPCGTVPLGAAAGFYCQANQQIYLEKSLGLPRYADDYEWGHYLKVLDHEYGHHIQARTNILPSFNLLYSSASTRARTLELNRRMELQANCFAGTAMKQSARVSTAQARRWTTVSKDSDTHGTADHRASWALNGFRHRDLQRCNTFSASGKEVR